MAPPGRGSGARRLDANGNVSAPPDSRRSTGPRRRSSNSLPAVGKRKSDL
jgi:hypothetical protein